MRFHRVFGIVGGAFLVARGVVGCASDTEGEPFDAGPLPDVVVGQHDAASAEGGSVVGVDGSDGASPASDASGANDAADASTPDAHDAGPGADASDAATLPDAGSHDDAGDAASIEDASDGGGAEDASDASSIDDASDASPLDAGTDGAPVVCAGYDAGANPILAVVATAGGNVVTDNGAAPAADPVSLVATTTPGLVADIAIGYCTANPCVAVFVPMAPGGDTDGGPGDATWTGAIPPQTAGTQVAWWVQAHDACGGGGAGALHYWSNFGSNFHYTTQ